MKKDIRYINFLKKCIQKDKESWDLFVYKYSSLVYQYIMKIFKRYSYLFNVNENEKEEIFHSIFLALLDDDCKKLKDFRGANERSFCAYLRQISFNLTIDYLSSRRKIISLEQTGYCISRKDNYKKLVHRDF